MNLIAVDHVEPKKWTLTQTTYVYIIDVMVNLLHTRTSKLKTYREFLEKLLMTIKTLCQGADSIYFVLDIYCEGSVKDSERVRRSDVRPINIIILTLVTPLPINMGTFWPSNANKHRLKIAVSQTHCYPYLIWEFIHCGIGMDDDMVPCELVKEQGL